MKKNFFAFSRIEKILILLCSVGIFFGALAPIYIFVNNFSNSSPAKGGIYREGVVAQPGDLVLNPVYVYGQREMSVESGIVNLLFKGLMSFNSKTGQLEDSLGEHFLSADKKTYTFRLKEGLRWHDGNPLTADDVVFTFHDVIQDEHFSNPALKKAFSGVVITKKSAREVSFTIQYPYKFFLTNFTVGLLPKHILKDVPIADLPNNSFSSHPIGNGPFFYDEIREVRPNVFTLSLQAFRLTSLPGPYLDTLEIWMYPSKESLSLDSKKLNGVAPFAKYIKDDMFLDSHLKPREFILPQYSALFFNLNKKIFQGESGKKLRLALQVGTNKKKVLEIIPSVRIDTPLLETKTDEWLYEYSLERANGAIKDAGYYFPSKKPKTIIPEKSSEQWISIPTKNPEYEFSGEKFILGGIYPKKAKTITIFRDGKEILTHTRGTLGPKRKPYPAPKWEFDFFANTHFVEGTQEIRVKFFDVENNLIFQDALSLYAQIPKGAMPTILSLQEKGDVSPSLKPLEEKITEEKTTENNSSKAPSIEKIDTQDQEKVSTPLVSPTSSPEIEKNNTAEIIEEQTEEQNSSNSSVSEIRETFEGEKISITLLTSSSPAFYGTVAEQIKKDWRNFGVDLQIKILPPQEFLDAVSHREYDILLFGENLGYNLDIYEFFHESQVGKENLSDYTNKKASTLIQEIRSSHVPEVRAKKLNELQGILKKDIPAIFLFSPIYEYYIDTNLNGVDIEKIAIMKDRFYGVENWYMKTEKTFQDDTSFVDYPGWISKQFISFITFSL